MPNLSNWISAARQKLVWFGGIYAIFVLILALPGAQTHALYAHWVRWPLWAKFDQPERYGLAVGKTLNLRIQTEDNLSLGAWFVFADGYYQQTACPSGSGSRCSSSFNNVDISRALRTHKTILYFHGNAASRALPHRVRFYSQWSSRVNVNVLAIDYRGFADSEGSPTEAGLGLDAKAAWDWAITHGAAPEDIIFFGQSLGTGVTAKLAHRLSVEGVHPRGVVLSGAFIDLATLLETYNIGGWIPLLQPMQFVPFFFKLLDKILIHKFATIELLPNVTAPILLIHGEDDTDIIIKHSQMLFDATIEPYLEQYPFTRQELSQVRMPTEEQRELVAAISKRRHEQTKKLVTEEQWGALGSFYEAERPGKGRVQLFRSTWGGHDDIINFETVMDVARVSFKL